MNNLLFVAGGYINNKMRTSLIEIFDPKIMKWLLFGLYLPKPMEAMSLI